MIVNTHLREGYPHQTGLDLFWQTVMPCALWKCSVWNGRFDQQCLSYTVLLVCFDQTVQKTERAHGLSCIDCFTSL